MILGASSENGSLQMGEEDAFLRNKARELIQLGLLPKRPDRTWGGFGSGGVCLLCGETIRPDQTEVEAEFNGVDGGNAVTQRFHARCYVTAEYEFHNPGSDGNGRHDGAIEASPVTSEVTASAELPQAPGHE